MKQFSFIFRSIMAFTMLAFFITSCDDNDLGLGSSSAPILEVTDNNGVSAGDLTLSPEETITLIVRGTSSSDSPMKNVRFVQDDATITDYNSRLTINGAAATSANVLLPDNETSYFEWTVTWKAHADQNSYTYGIQIVDEAGNSDSEYFIVNTTSQSSLAVNLITGGPTGNSISSDATLTADSYMRVTIEGIKGANPLTFLEVQEDNTTIAVNRLYFTDITSGNEFLSNPTPIEGDGVNGFTQDILVKIHPTPGVTKVYSFLVSDETEAFEYAQLSITTQGSTNPTTPITQTLTAKLLYNAAGPAGKGALDLDFGYSTGTITNGTNATPIDAEIKDMGLDANNGLWRKEIAPMNNATLRKLSSSAEFPVDFNATADVETITAAYNDATSVSVTDSNPSLVAPGDMYVIERNGSYYLVICTNINDDPNSNSNDYYEFNIKY